MISGVKLFRPLFTLVCCGLVFSHFSVLADKMPHVPGVDWERKVIRATGAGAPDLRAPNIAVARLGAERAARLDAIRNILETMQGVQVTSTETAGGIVAGDPALKARVEGLVRNFSVVDTRYYADGGVEVDVEMSLVGELGLSLLPHARTPGDKQELREAKPEPAQQEDSPQTPAQSPGGEQPSKNTDSEKRHTSVIVDASGLELVPALAPRILDETGNEIYGAAKVDSKAIGERGIATYRNSLDAARGEVELVGASPLVIRAVNAQGTDVVIASTDAAGLISQESGAESFLSEGRVVLVIDNLGGRE